MYISSKNITGQIDKTEVLQWLTRHMLVSNKFNNENATKDVKLHTDEI